MTFALSISAADATGWTHTLAWRAWVSVVCEAAEGGCDGGSVLSDTDQGLAAQYCHQQTVKCSCTDDEHPSQRRLHRDLCDLWWTQMTSGCCAGFDACFTFLFLSPWMQGNVWVHILAKQGMKHTVGNVNVTSLTFEVNVRLLIIAAFHAQKSRKSSK